ncbi:MAG: cell division protein FtsZ [Candidatus Micrarchaeia archaeon]
MEMDAYGAKISVVGVGGAGCNTINRLTNLGIKSAETIALNSDKMHLNITNAHKKHILGYSLTKGLGCGGFPEVGMKAAECDKEKIRELLEGSELVFVTAGMGGGTGTGGAPVVARIAKEMGACVIGMVTFPFALERARLKKALWGISELRKSADTVVLIDNNKLASYVPDLPVDKAFALADEIVSNAVMGISDTIQYPSLINIDFADIKALMENKGLAVISIGEGSGGNRVEDAIKDTLKNPLLEVDYTGANGALIHISGGDSLTLGDATRIGEGVSKSFDDNANILWGARVNPELQDHIIVTAIITGVKSRILDETFVPDLQYTKKAEHIESLSTI